MNTKRGALGRGYLCAHVEDTRYDGVFCLFRFVGAENYNAQKAQTLFIGLS
jgi:hypothetical protein